MACLRTTAPAALLCWALLAAAAGGGTAAALPLSEDGACPEGYVVCMDGDGCVPTEVLCDGTHDCKDHSDELPFRCAAPSSEAPARDKEALEPSAGAGAGAVEAAVGEQEGAPPTPTPCLDSEHRCLDGTCISKARMCDSTRDCHDGSDEDALAGCSQASGNATLEEGDPNAEWVGPETPNGVDHLPLDHPAPAPPPPRRRSCNEPHEFACNDGTCISRNLTCDQRSDCPDGSDETIACPTMLESCHDDFECADGLCLPKDWVCDGHPDCRDSSDEHPLLCTNWKKRPLVVASDSPDPMHAHSNVARDSGDPCERMEPQERQRCWDDQLHKLKVEEVQLRQRVAREQLDAAQAEVAAAKQLRQEQLQTAQLQRKAAEELLQQQQELHSLRLQTLKHAVAAALSEPAAESITPSDLHAANSGSDQAAAAAATE
ncbi:hypothetical protein R5R35_000899 [Gryllus longicercus]|uniref:Uncharacterized protein n=1 Tax=Gryllus longicercus TaxID=2509291 RepID=A0AAN9W4D3_9ORTH